MVITERDILQFNFCGFTSLMQYNTACTCFPFPEFSAFLKSYFFYSPASRTEQDISVE